MRAPHWQSYSNTAGTVAQPTVRAETGAAPLVAAEVNNAASRAVPAASTVAQPAVNGEASLAVPGVSTGGLPEANSETEGNTNGQLSLVSSESMRRENKEGNWAFDGA